jgi:trigger factor
VNEIKRIEPHAVDQELFDKLYGPGEVNAENVMREKVKADLEQMFSRDSDFLFKREFAKKITENVDPQLPDSFLKRYIQLTNEKPVTAEMVEHDYPFYAAQLRWELIEGKIIRKYELRVSPEDAITHVKQVLASRYAQYGLPMEDEMLTEFAKQTLAKKEEAKNVYDFLYEEKMIAVVKEKCTLNEISIGYEDFIHKVQHA